MMNEGKSYAKNEVKSKVKSQVKNKENDEVKSQVKNEVNSMTKKAVKTGMKKKNKKQLKTVNSLDREHGTMKKAEKTLKETQRLIPILHLPTLLVIHNKIIT